MAQGRVFWGPCSPLQDSGERVLRVLSLCEARSSQESQCIFSGWDVPEDPALDTTAVVGEASSLSNPGHITTSLGLIEAHLIGCWKYKCCRVG